MTAESMWWLLDVTSPRGEMRTTKIRTDSDLFDLRTEESRAEYRARLTRNGWSCGEWHLSFGDEPDIADILARKLGLP